MIANSIIMIIGRGLMLLLGVILAIVLARTLGPDARGTLAIIILSINLTSVVFEMGLPEASIYVLGKNLDEKSSSIQKLFTFSCIIAILSIPIVGLFLYFFSSFAQNLDIFIVLAISSSISISYARHILLGLDEFFSYSLNILIEASIYLFLITLLYFFYLDYFTRDNIVGAYTIAVIFSQLAAWMSVRRKIKSIENKESFSIAFDLDFLIDTFNKGKHLFLAGVAGFLQQRIIFYILSQILGSRSVGLYTVAGTLPNLLVHLPQQVATVVYSSTSKISSEEEKDSKINAIVFFIQITFLMVLLCFLITLPISEYVIHLFFGDEFRGTGLIFSTLILCAGFMGITTLIFNALAGIGMHKFSSYIGVASTLGVSLFCLYLAPILGILGAALSQLIISFFACVIGLYLLKRFYEFRLTKFFISPVELWRSIT